MFENNLIAGVSGQGGGYSINDSLRFNDNDSAYLSRTPATASNRKTWTWSAWVKRGLLADRQGLFSAGLISGTYNYHTIHFDSNDKLNVVYYPDTTSTTLITTQVFRDPSAWYHIVVAWDTTQATASNRVKVYVNGAQVTAFGTATYSSQNTDGFINSTAYNSGVHLIGRFTPNDTAYFDGYMAEVNFIDGQALTPDDFGEINATTGEWSPIEYEGTYGTNGFYLPFDGNANDSSGNGNNWTENNLASTDYMISTPTNNFNVFNVIAAAPSSADTYEEGNLEATNSTVDPRTSITTIPVSSGKWYAEFYYQAQTSNAIVFGVVTDSYSPSSSTLMAYLVSSGGGVVGYFGFNGNKYIDGVSTGYGSSFTVGDIIGVALNLDDNEITFYKNNVSQGVITSKTFSGAYNFFTASGTGGGGQRSLLNAGQDSSFAGLKTRQGNTDANGIGDFYYAPPAGGYLALCTDNLPEPAIVQPETQFNVVLYTGDGTDDKAITGVGFQPDMVWIKSRSNAFSHNIYDSVRGVSKRIQPNLTNAESSPISGVKSFDADGFTLGNDTDDTNFTSGVTYVAWCWKAGGTAVSNTDGSITSQVSANVDAGFSIVSYTGNGTNPSTIGHGLGVVPAMIITRVRSTTGEWPVYHQSLTPDYTLYLYATYAASTYQNRYDYSAFTSSVYSSHATSGGEINTSGQTYIAYCFAEIEGFSKFGSYVGNGSTNGPFVYTGTGFKPAFVMIKRTDSG
jgi:hypothetical protein